jgi:ADP-heptose:LPS heptosyltransferase
VTNYTGTMHIAFAHAGPTLVLFGLPEEVVQWGPDANARCRALTPKDSRSLDHAAALASITPDEALDAAEALLHPDRGIA